ncbi:MAG: SMP-30/gluconolactonase/LRE family protein [Planctomycetota bacterium]
MKIISVIVIGLIVVFCPAAGAKAGVVAPDANVEKLADTFSFTEGPAADAGGSVYFTDQPNDKIYVRSTEGKLSVFLDGCERSNGLYFDADGSLLACADLRNRLVSFDPNGKMTILVENYKGKKLNGPNDLWRAPNGGIYFTDPFYRRKYWSDPNMEQDCQCVYYLAPDRKTLTRVADDLMQPNGIIGTPDGKLLYVADIGANKTYVYITNPDGTLSNKKLFCEMGSDGMTIDNEGNIYLTGRGVTVFNSAGEKIDHIDIKENWTANVTFGGKDNDTLFITASKSLYAVKMRTKGVTWATTTSQENDLASEKWTFELTVIDKQTGQPIPNAKLKLTFDDQKGTTETNEDGKRTLRLHKGKTNYLSIEVTKEGFVPIRLGWRSSETTTGIPAGYTVALESGTSIGGVIQDEQGKPIEGASVYLLIPGKNEAERVAIADYEVKTDAAGRWRCDIVPAKLDDIWIRLAHPDFISDEMYGITPKPSIEQLRDMTGVMAMKKGIAIAGRVVDVNGKPIKGATVAQGSDRNGSEYPSTKTDEQGWFKFNNARPSEMVLTVQASGFAPDLKEITVYETMKAVEFLLGSGQTIKGRVVDANGNPISEAFVTADTWRGHRSIEWRVNTDANGRFCWKNAPTDDVLFDIGQTGYMSVRGRAMSPSDSEYVITMHPPLKVSGKVTDAESGDPVKQFKIIPGIDWGTGQPVYWEQRNSKNVSDGHYEISFDFPYPAHLLRVEAEGYKPVISRHFDSNEGQVTFDFKLVKGTGFSGVVKSPDGAPAVGAEVILCTKSRTAYISNGRIAQKEDSVFVETDTEGRFSFPPQTEKYILAVLHDKGYAEVTAEQLEKSSSIILQPWGRVEGTLRIGNKLGVNENIEIPNDLPDDYDPNEPRVFYYNRTTTDNNGRFVLERLRAGNARVARGIKTSDRMTSFSHTVPVEIRAGETATVSIGGTGRPVIGKVVADADYNEPVNWSFGQSSISTIMPESPKPDNFNEMTDEEKKVWHQKWQDSNEGEAFRERTRKQQRNYTIKIDPDGLFRVEDVPEGEYNLNISIYEPPAARQCGYGDSIGSAHQEFEISEMPGGRSDEPCDLGTLRLETLKRLKVGDVAATFEVNSLDGGKIRLADYRGKLVLLNFWATWCGPCMAEVPNLKKVFDEYGKDERFVMIGLSLDRDPNPAKKSVASKQMNWPQAFIGDLSKSDVAKEYGVQGIPATFLIDPDGKILSKDLRGGQMKTEVAKAIEKIKDPPKKTGIIVTGAKVEKLADGFSFTEGPIADEKGNVYFTDIPNNRIHKWSVEGKLSTFRENSGGANGLDFDDKGNLLVCEGGNRRITRIDMQGNVTVLCDNYKGKKLNSPNDLWRDKKGGIYFTDPHYGQKKDDMELPGEYVFYLPADSSEPILVISDMNRPNGIVGTDDGKLLYVADHGGNKTWVYKINDDSTLADKKLFAPMGADGITLDEQGNLYLTGRGVTVLDPNGKQIATINLGPNRPSNVCFGGEDGKTLFITARGSLFSIRMNVKGQ